MIIRSVKVRKGMGPQGGGGGVDYIIVGRGDRGNGLYKVALYLTIHVKGFQLSLHFKASSS